MAARGKSWTVLEIRAYIFTIGVIIFPSLVKEKFLPFITHSDSIPILFMLSRLWTMRGCRCSGFDLMYSWLAILGSRTVTNHRGWFSLHGDSDRKYNRNTYPYRRASSSEVRTESNAIINSESSSPSYGGRCSANSSFIVYPVVCDRRWVLANMTRVAVPRHTNATLTLFSLLEGGIVSNARWYHGVRRGSNFRAVVTSFGDSEFSSAFGISRNVWAPIKGSRYHENIVL